MGTTITLSMEATLQVTDQPLRQLAVFTWPFDAIEDAWTEQGHHVMKKCMIVRHYTSMSMHLQLQQDLDQWD